MRVDRRDLRLRMEACPVGETQRRLLIVVEDRHAEHHVAFRQCVFR
jgi:hypothetical protein